MDDEFQNFISLIKKIMNEKKASKDFLFSESETRIYGKIEPFDYNYKLYFNISLRLEDLSGNSVETSIDQIQAEDKIDEVDLHKKMKKVYQELLEELTSFQSE